MTVLVGFIWIYVIRGWIYGFSILEVSYGKFRGFTHGLSMVIIQLIIDILVGGDWNHGILNDFPYIGNVIIPTDELIFFRGVGQSQTRQYWRFPMGASPKWMVFFGHIRSRNG